MWPRALWRRRQPEVHARIARPLARNGSDSTTSTSSTPTVPTHETPLDETAGALHHAVRSGTGALRRYLVVQRRGEPCRSRACSPGSARPLVIHQPSYSMLNRWIETEGLLDAAGELGFGVIGFTPLAQGMLTGKYLAGIPADSRAAADASLARGMLGDAKLE